MKLQRKLISIVLLVFIFVIGPLIFLISTQPGLNLLYKIAQHTLPGKLQIEKLQGRLIGNIDIEQLSYQDSQNAVHINTMALHWRAWHLVSGRLMITQATIDGLQVRSRTSSTPDTATKSVGLPINITVLQLQAKHINLKLDNKNYQIRSLQFQGKTTEQSLSIKQLVAETPDYQLTLMGKLGWAFPQNTAIHLAVKSISDDVENFSSELHLEGTAQQLNLKGDIKTPYKAHINGHITFTGNKPSVNIQANWQQLTWPLIGSPIVQSQNGKLSVVGPLSHYQFTLQSALSSELSKKQTINVQGSGDRNALSISQLQTQLLGGDINGQAKVSWHDGWQWQTQLHARGIDPSKLLPSWPGNVNASVNSSGSLKPQLKATVSVSNLSGQLHGKALSGQINATVNHETITITQAKLNLASNHIQVQGKINKQWQLDWQVMINNVADFIPDAGGKIISKGKLDGALTNPNLVGQLTIQQFYYQDNRIKQLAAIFNLHSDDTAESKVSINANDVQINHTTINAIKINANGQKTEQHLQLQLTSDEVALAFKLHNRYQKNQWQAQVSQFDIKSKQYNLRLQKPLPLNYSKNKVRWQHFCLLSKNQSLCSQGTIDFSDPFLPSWLDAKLAVKLTINLGDLSLIDLLNNQFSNTQGQATVNIDIDGRLNKPRLTGKVALQNASTRIEQLGITLKPVSIQLQADQLHNIVYQGSLTSGKGTLSFKGDASIQQNSYRTNTKITGNNFTVINTDNYNVDASPDLQLSTEGKKIKLSGTITIPQALIAPKDFSQTLELPDDVIFINKQEQRTVLPWDINSQVHLKLGDKVNVKVFGISGRLTGNLHIQDQPGQPTTGTGKLQVVDGKYNAYGQQLTIDKGELLFTGGAVDNPNLNVRAFRKITLYSSENSVLPNLLQLNTQTPITNTQSIGQEQSLTVGVQVTGPLRKPKIGLYSIPASYSQSDILSYLLLGRPVASASKADSQLLLRAVSALNIGGNNAGQINNQLQRALGLDVISFTSKPQYDADTGSYVDSSAVVLGKALSSRLFINYTFGLLQGSNVVRIRYLLTKQWILQSETDGNANGFDIFYRIQRP